MFARIEIRVEVEPEVDPEVGPQVRTTGWSTSWELHWVRLKDPRLKLHWGALAELHWAC